MATLPTNFMEFIRGGLAKQQQQSPFTGQFNSQIPVDRKPAFDQWVASQQQKGKNVLADMEDYDVHGFFLSGAATDERGHGTDKFKKPNHPTFSNESMYHGQSGNQGGEWIQQNGKTYFRPGPTNLKYRTWQQLQEYFKQYEPDVILLPPAQ